MEIMNKTARFEINYEIMRLVNNAEDLLKDTSKPTYITHKILVKIMLLFMKLNRF